MIGQPVGHSLSPALHNAAFAALSLDWVYVALEVPAGQVPAAIAGARALSLAALSVTMPHKAAVAAEMDRLSATAAQLGAVNTVTRRGSDLVGDSTDGEGLLAALRADQGCEPAGRHCLVLGTGGAARAVILALAGAGAATVGVVGRRPEAAAAAAALAGPAGQVAPISAAAGADVIVNATPVGMAARPAGQVAPISAAAGADVIVNATPVGMAARPAGESPIGLVFGLEPGWLGPGQLVVDLIYSPPSTPLLDAARAAGARAANGLGTLIHQAAEQLRLWTGMDPPLEVMSAAAIASLPAPGTDR